MGRVLKFIVCFVTLQLAHAQISEDIWKEDLSLLNEFLSIPNNSLVENDIDKNLVWLYSHFKEIGFKVERLKTNGLDLLYAEKQISKLLPTVLFYMHFDGQPVDDTKWFQDDGYSPVLKNKKDEKSDENIEISKLSLDVIFDNHIRIYARSASDDKGPIAMFLSSLNHLEIEGKLAKFNLKIVLDSQEEQGSPHLADAVKTYKDLLKSDYFVVFDGPMHDSGLPTLFYGVRGISTIHMEVYGMARPQHSGHYGNYGPNPIFRASEILNSLKDTNGKVIIPGYYDAITFNEDIGKIMSDVPDDPEILRKRAGFANAEKVGKNYQEAMQYPSLNVSGISSGWVNEEARTIIPDKTIIEMDIRTVVETDADDLIKKLKNHITYLGYKVMEQRPTEEELLIIEKPVFFQYQNSMFPFRTSINSKIGNWLRKALQNDTNKRIVQIRTAGGSVPLSFFINELNVPTVLVPLVNADNNQHSPNENLKLSNYFEGIETIKRILQTKID